MFRKISALVLASSLVLGLSACSTPTPTTVEKSGVSVTHTPTATPTVTPEATVAPEPTITPTTTPEALTEPQAVAEPEAQVAPVEVSPIVPVAPDWAEGLPACDYEDSVNCYWDATQQGNGEGISYYNDEQGDSHYVAGDAPAIREDGWILVEDGTYVNPHFFDNAPAGVGTDSVSESVVAPTAPEPVSQPVSDVTPTPTPSIDPVVSEPVVTEPVNIDPEPEVVTVPGIDPIESAPTPSLPTFDRATMGPVATDTPTDTLTPTA